MKNVIIPIWYGVVIIMLLIFDADPRKIAIGVVVSILIVPVSIVNIFITVHQWIRFRFNWKGWLAIFIFTISAYQLAKLYTYHGEQNHGEIKVLSYNTSFFRIPSLYSPEYFNPHRPTVNDSIIDWLIAQDADFLLLQEFFDDVKSTDFNNVKTIMERGGYVDYYYINAPRHDNGTSRGLIIFSKHPLFKKRQLFLGENRFNGALEVLTTWHGDTLRLVNVHLKSSAFELRKNLSSPAGMWHEVKKFIGDGALKAHQVDLVLDSIASTGYPTIIAGDFNSTRYNYVYAKMRQDHTSMFRERGKGWGYTFYGWFGLPLKLDHQFYRGGIEGKTVEIGKEMRHSDHLPVIATYDIDHSGN